MQGHPSAISAVVRTLNSERTLAEALRSIRRQDSTVQEIVVVDSGSSDGTLGIAKKFDCRTVFYARDRPFNYSESLNLGIAETASDLILILSSHMVLGDTGIVRKMRDNLKYFNACGAYCMPASIPRNDRPDANTVNPTLITVVHSDIYDGHNGLWNCCSLISRSCWEQHPFDTTLPTVEDQEWALWHYRNTNLPTVCIRNAGVLYLNPHFSDRKYIRDRVVVATRLIPSQGSWRAILGLLLEACIAAFDRRFRIARRTACLAWELARQRFWPRNYTSKYY